MILDMLTFMEAYRPYGLNINVKIGVESGLLVENMYFWHLDLFLCLGKNVLYEIIVQSLRRIITP